MQVPTLLAAGADADKADDDDVTPTYMAAEKNHAEWRAAASGENVCASGTAPGNKWTRECRPGSDLRRDYEALPTPKLKK